MQDDGILKQLLYGELAESKRPAHKSKLRYKNYIKCLPSKAKIMQNDLEILAVYRSSWKQTLHIKRNFEQNLVTHEKVTRYTEVSVLISLEMSKNLI